MVREVVEKAVLTGWRGHLSCALLKCAGQPFLGTPHSGPWLLAVGDEQRAKVSEPIITYTLAPITETLQEPDSGELPTPPTAPTPAASLQLPDPEVPLFPSAGKV